MWPRARWSTTARCSGRSAGRQDTARGRRRAPAAGVGEPQGARRARRRYGPGCTGTRIGLAVARGLALGLGIEGWGLDAGCPRGRRGGAPPCRRRAAWRGVRPGRRRHGPRGRAGGRSSVRGGRRRRYREVLEARERRSRPTMTRVMRRGQSFTRPTRDGLRAGRVDRADLRSPRTRERWAGGDARARAAAAGARRPRRDRADRGGVLPDALVPLDVRVRARKAELALVRGGRRDRRPRRIPRPLPLRRRVARDERRGRAGEASPGCRLGAAAAPARATEG